MYNALFSGHGAVAAEFYAYAQPFTHGRNVTYQANASHKKTAKPI